MKRNARNNFILITLTIINCLLSDQGTRQNFSEKGVANENSLRTTDLEHIEGLRK
jgi:hypothetical protein